MLDVSAGGAVCAPIRIQFSFRRAQMLDVSAGGAVCAPIRIQLLGKVQSPPGLGNWF